MNGSSTPTENNSKTSNADEDLKTYMPLSHPHGNAENILRFVNNNKISVNNEQLKKLFDHPEVRDRKIVVFSIIGAYRKGKSFFLDYCLRFLYAHYKSINNPTNPCSDPSNWIGSETEPLKGFSWRSGPACETKGIVMWNDVFLHTSLDTNEKFAIVVMDTQGLFDNETSPTENSRIFALGTLISSVQVLNLTGVVQEDQLQYLQFATEFARLSAAVGSNMRPFQNLMFLIRDWVYPDHHNFGIEGGEEYLQKFLEVKNDQKPELRSVRKFIHNSFENISCALLPHPGSTVAGGKRQSRKYDGNWREMDEEFKEEIEKLIDHLLKPDNLVPKRINGKDVKSSEFLAYIDQYFKLFSSNLLPEAQSIYETTVEQQLSFLINSCFDNYLKSIQDHESSIISINYVSIVHKMCKLQSLLLFKDSMKMGNSEHERKFRKNLENRIDNFYAAWAEKTTAKVRKDVEEKEKSRLAALEMERLKCEEQKYLRQKDVNELRIKIGEEEIKRKLAEKERDAEKNKRLEAEEHVEAIKAEMTDKDERRQFGFCGFC
ncbi:atlastin-2-like [Chironomus tepperi]|uniref:atlastin-2-like n=1 Tax=Chironomus tepperi TaxID=113505 RepID=UPI00391FC92A